MNREEFKQLTRSKIVYLDGATGSNLQAAGMPSGVCPEQWILNNKEALIELQKGYLNAGTDIILAPTFTSNRVKLSEYGLEKQVGEINLELVKLTKEAVKRADLSGRKAYIAADITMVGQQLYPMGKMMFEELVDVYKEQVTYLLMSGVDLFIVETMMSLQECRAALLAIRELCDLPVMVSLTYNEDNRTLYGTNPETAMVVLQELGADAVGVNCSVGPDKMGDIITAMKSVARIPVIAKPNAGLPSLVNGKTVFTMEAEEFSQTMLTLIEAGAGIVGGCCGTTIKHIERLVQQSAGMTPPIVNHEKRRMLTTERTVYEFALDGPFVVVGERINPTGKKALQEQLKVGDFSLVCEMAEEQVEKGASILDVNVGMNGIDEKETMIQAIYEIIRTVDVPLCIDSSHVDIIEAALRIYPGRGLINSISLEQEKFEKLIPIAKKYGAMFILLPLSDAGLPGNMEEKIEIIHKIMERADQFGLTKEDIIVDGLVNTVGANSRAAIDTMETIRYCKNRLGVATIVGLSNISFGLPQRQFVNSTFLAFAIKEGLTMAIANPSQDLLMNTALASDLLLAKEDSDVRYIEQSANHNVNIVTGENNSKKPENIEIQSNKGSENEVFQCVVKGNQKHILEVVKKEAALGTMPSDILNNMLIPAINHVGELFEKQIYFLPQLIASANTMKIAIEYLEPMLKDGRSNKSLGTIVLATVDGDVHDIGKNLVALMLKNYGFDVIDLGKDVNSELIIQTAKENEADIIGLSALMTTTMMEMKTVVTLVKEAGLKAKVIIGGAVITEGFAEEIGADGYSKDAGDAVKLVKRLLSIS